MYMMVDLGAYSYSPAASKIMQSEFQEGMLERASAKCSQYSQTQTVKRILLPVYGIPTAVDLASVD